jgi:hypothetical protein
MEPEEFAECRSAKIVIIKSFLDRNEISLI